MSDDFPTNSEMDAAQEAEYEHTQAVVAATAQKRREYPRRLQSLRSHLESKPPAGDDWTLAGELKNRISQGQELRDDFSTAERLLSQYRF